MKLTEENLENLLRRLGRNDPEDITLVDAYVSTLPIEGGSMRGHTRYFFTEFMASDHPRLCTLGIALTPLTGEITGELRVPGACDREEAVLPLLPEQAVYVWARLRGVYHDATKPLREEGPGGGVAP